MDWSRTKTIFILIFLILDLFLVFQFIEKRSSGQLDYITESTIEEQLEADDITYVELPKADISESYITGKRKKFTEAEVANLTNQNISFLSDEWIISHFDEPIQLRENNLDTQFKQILEENVLFGDSYVFWGWNKVTNKLLFFQTYNGRPLYFNENAMLSLQLNGENQLISYEQTFLTDLTEIIEEGTNHEILPVLKAIENLYKKNYLTSGSHVTNVELGYYKNVPISGDMQFFAPTWHIVVDNQHNYFVNAIEGQVMELIQDGVEKYEFAF
ncbi:two-component system regulatory protein YycI [Bacillus sp. Marseille-P3661]|uniref:two-component system regulatory protein YycI n=1 Tax=Bacillus sp. Marseille-P3661 TaxID=1936234 RepID=UPI000C82AA8B|nr:two-component system regulatory protein YycI [Bacillus sp. Marseille-P3661]